MSTLWINRGDNNIMNGLLENINLSPHGPIFLNNKENIRVDGEYRK